jgi:steroid 5-alpha reductase family enzyme
MSALLLIVTALAGLCAFFAGLFLLCRRLDNYGFVDVAWSYAFALLAGFYAMLGSGWPPRRLILAIMAGLWSLRLGTHLLRRVASHHPVEDGRYVQLREDWAGNFGPKMFGFFQLQAGSVALLGVPFLLPVINPAAILHPLEIAGAVLWLLAISGELLADAQLAAFKRDIANKGRVCDAGLWRFSRHPNYFFEWLIWVAYFVFALGSPWGWLAVIGPASILFLLLNVTGIPLTEQQAVRSKGDAYRRYQATTSAFVPWFPKKFSTTDEHR